MFLEQHLHSIRKLILFRICDNSKRGINCSSLEYLENNEN